MPKVLEEPDRTAPVTPSLTVIPSDSRGIYVPTIVITAKSLP